MSEDHLRQIFSEGGPNWLEELSKTGLSSQDIVDLLDTQTYFELLKPLTRHSSLVLWRD